MRQREPRVFFYQLFYFNQHLVRKQHGGSNIIVKIFCFHHQFATEALKEYIGKPIYSINDINKIQNVVAEHYNITIEDLKSKKRMAYINIPRQVAMYLCRMTTEETVVKIGLEFGNRDHSTVIHSCEKISNELKENKTFKEEIEEIKNKIVN